MCGLILPSAIRYDTDWCWMCWRNLWELGHNRYYVKAESDNSVAYYEEVQTLRGIFPFSKENEPIIQEAIKKERDKPRIVKTRINY